MMKCERCNGLGYTSEHDPDDPHKGGVCTSCPIAIQCEQCMGSGENLECKAEVAAAVDAERRRVKKKLMECGALPAEDVDYMCDWLFDDGEPTAEESSVDEAAPNCLTCGHKMAIVRPGKHQCENDDCPDQS